MCYSVSGVVYRLLGFKAGCFSTDERKRISTPRTVGAGTVMIGRLCHYWTVAQITVIIQIPEIEEATVPKHAYFFTNELIVCGLSFILFVNGRYRVSIAIPCSQQGVIAFFQEKDFFLNCLDNQAALTTVRAKIECSFLRYIHT